MLRNIGSLMQIGRIIIDSFSSKILLRYLSHSLVTLTVVSLMTYAATVKNFSLVRVIFPLEQWSLINRALFHMGSVSYQ